MADVESNESTPLNATVSKGDDPTDLECASKQDNPTNKIIRPDDFKMCSPSNPFKTSSTNPFASEHNKFVRGILKPSVLSLNSSSAACGSLLLRQSGFNPPGKSTIEKKSDNSDKKQVNGEVQKFVPLIKNNEAQIAKPDTSQCNNTTKTTSASSTFVFGQNLQERVISDAKSEPTPSSSSIVTSNGNSSSASDMLFSSAIKNEVKSIPTKEKETKSLTESAREYEESRANKRKYEEVQVKTGEEEETNILSISCKLFAFDKATGNWQERGRGTLRLNDLDDSQIGSRLVFRTAGSLRVILNTKIWAEMTVDKANEKSVRLTATDSDGEIKVFLIMSSIEDSFQLYTQLQHRLEKEVALQKRKKPTADELDEK